MASPSTGWHQVYCLVTEAHVRKQQLAKGCTPQRQRQRCEPATCWSKVQQSNHLLLSLHFNGHFPGKPELAGVYQGKGWWRWRWHLVWSHKSCKLSQIITTNKPTSSFFLQARCPSCCPTNSVKALKGKYRIPWTCLPQAHLGSSNSVSDQQQLLLILGEGCHASHQPSDASTPTTYYYYCLTLKCLSNIQMHQEASTV